MGKENPISQVLVTSGNQAVLTAGNRVDSLKHGQIGVFNVHTGLSIDGSVDADEQDVFIAVGINRSAGTDGSNMEDFTKSAAQFIAQKGMRAYMFKGYVPEVAKVMEVTSFKPVAETPFGLKIEFRNQKSYELNGYNAFVKTYGTYAANADAGFIAEDIINRINADTDKLVTASAFAYQISFTVTAAATGSGNLTVTVGAESFTVAITSGDTTTVVAAKIAAAINAVSTSIYAASSAAAVLYVFPKVSAKTGSTSATIALTAAGGTGVTVGSITAANVNISNTTTFRTANPNAGIGIRITGTAEARPSYANDLNIKYHKTGTDFLVSTPYGFDANTQVVMITELQYVEGSGYDIKRLEYLAGGWNGRPGVYRQSPTTGLARDGFEYFTKVGTNYHQFVLHYGNYSDGHSGDYRNNCETLIAIPVADTTTLSGLVAVLDAIYPKFGAHAGDVTANDTEQLSTNELSPATDGIEIVS